jgi:hypothetical protein
MTLIPERIDEIARETVSRLCLDEGHTTGDNERKFIRSSLTLACEEQAQWSARIEREECLRDVDAEAMDCLCSARIRKRIVDRAAAIRALAEGIR